MILILEYEGEEEKSKTDIRTDAMNIKKKIDRVDNTDTKILKTEVELREYLRSPASKNESKLHIVCHGNRQQVGNFNAAQLGKFLWDSGLNNRKNIVKITLHSCDSGVEVTRTDNGSWTPSLAWQLASYFSGVNQRMTVRGYMGHSITDSEGHNWVLKDGMKMDKTPSHEREIVMLEQRTQPRGTARPKFAAIYGGGVTKL